MRRSIAGAIALLAIAAPSASADTVASLPSGASVLFALEARSGSFTRVPGRPHRYTLALRGVARGTTWFTDRPQREAGRVTTRSLLGSWRSLGFAAEPPNAAVVLDDGRRARDTVALELRLRSRDNRRRTARFRVRVLPGLGPGLSRLNRRLDRRLPKHFAGASLFIDSVTSTSCTIGQPRLFGFSWLADESSYVPADGRFLQIGVPGAVQALRDAVRRRRPARFSRAQPATPAAGHVLAGLRGRYEPELPPDAGLPNGRARSLCRRRTRGRRQLARPAPSPPARPSAWAPATDCAAA